MEDKKNIRLRYIQKRKELSFEEKRVLDSILFGNTINSDEFNKAEIVLGFYPIKNEPDVLPIFLHALDCGKRLAFPISNMETYELTFRFINDFSDLTIGAYNIPEPNSECKLYENSSNTICIVPALAFDRQGYRLGYGKGFYDRFLSDFNGVSLGLCYNDFLCELLPTEPTDRKVDMIITEKEVIYV